MDDFKSIRSETDRESGRSKIIGFKNGLKILKVLYPRGVILLAKNKDRIIARDRSIFTSDRSVC